MIFNNPTKYAIRAMTFLGGRTSGRFVSIREISRATNISLPFLAKVINRLARRRLVTAKRGPGGGVMLSRPAGRITVSEIVDAMGSTRANKQCILGLSECSDQAPCPVHDNWKGVRQVLLESLHTRTVTDLVRSFEAKQALSGKS
jgi:Rrf2 family iron-sulfur cluster assembly transcriptional regulator